MKTSGPADIFSIVWKLGFSGPGLSTLSWPTDGRGYSVSIREADACVSENFVGASSHKFGV